MFLTKFKCKILLKMTLCFLKGALTLDESIETIKNCA